MSITAAELLAIVGVRGADEAALKLVKVGAAADSAGAQLATLAAVGTVLAGAGLVALGVHAVQMAGDFQQSITKLYTTAGEAKSNLQMVGDGILAMSSQVGTGAQTLVNAMYYVGSAGFHGKQGLDVLKIAAMGAKAENSDLTSVVKTLVSTLNAYAGTGLTASRAMNTLIAATSQGHMTLNDLSGAISNVLPATARFHISLIDTTGAIAEMTKQGDNASSAATHLRQMILALESPSKIGAKALKEVGLTTQQVSDAMKKSLPDTLQMITEAVGRKFPEGSAAYNKAIRDIAGGSRQMMGFLELTGAHLNDFKDIVAKMTDQVKSGGDAIMGWADVQQNFNFKVDAAKAAVEAFFITLGTHLLPVLGSVLDKITPFIAEASKLVDQFALLVNPTKQVAMAMQPIIDMSRPLVDTFDRASSVMKATTVAAKPLIDTFDRAKSTIKDTTQVAKPFLDTFDRASGVINATTVAGNQVNPVLQNLYQTMKNVAQGAGDAVRVLRDMASNVQIAAPVLAGLGSILLAVVVPAMTSLAASIIVASWPLVTLGAAVGGLVYLLLQFHPEITTIAGAFQMLAPIIQNTSIALAVFFTPAIIKAGIEAVISAAKITYNFVASLILTGAQGWAAAGKLAVYIGALIASGYQAVIAAAKITFSFIASLIATASAAYASAFAVTGSFVPALGLVGIQALLAAGKLLTGLIPALYATGAAFYAALGPIGLVLGAVALAIAAFAAMKHQSDVMSLGVSGAFDTMGNKVQRSTGRIIATADQMKNGVSDSANQMKNNVDSSFNTMQNQSISDVRTLTSDAMDMFANMGNQVGIDMANMSQDAIDYWNNVAGYIANHPITGTVHYTTTSGGAPLMHNAEGTNFSPGGMSWVGERGPEIMYIPRGAQIIPNNKIGSMGGGSAPAIHNHIDVYLDGQRMTGQLMPRIVQSIRTATGARI